MKTVICTNCDADNLIVTRNEDYICGSCKEQVSLPDYESLYQSEKRRADHLYDANEEIADRLRERDEKFKPREATPLMKKYGAEFNEHPSNKA